jgi:hypothetical protein
MPTSAHAEYARSKAALRVFIKVDACPATGELGLLVQATKLTTSRLWPEVGRYPRKHAIVDLRVSQSEEPMGVEGAREVRMFNE